jgi:RNA polymerase sigma factor (sigma-70 family)
MDIDRCGRCVQVGRRIPSSALPGTVLVGAIPCWLDRKKINYSRRLGMIQHTLSDYVYQHGAIDIATDHDLVEAARSGNEEAFVKLWNHHSKKIFRTVIRIVKNREDAEDVLQEVCLRSFINIQRFDGRSKIYTWITRIAINTALMMLRRKRARSPMVTLADADGWHPLDIPDESIDIEESCARNERAALLRKAVSSLSPKLQTVIEMYLSQDMSLIEIAELTGTSVVAAKSRIFRARAALRKSLDCKLYPIAFSARPEYA